MIGFSVTVPGRFEDVVAKVTEALKPEGFGVLTEIDVKTTLKKKIDVDVRPQIILGACNPKLAHRALTAEPDIALLLPCNVVVREDDDGSITVGFMDPEAVLKLVKNPEIESLAHEVKAKLLRVRDALLK